MLWGHRAPVRPEVSSEAALGFGPTPTSPTQGPAGAKGHVPTPLLLESGQAPAAPFTACQLGARSTPGLGLRGISLDYLREGSQINASLFPEKLPALGSSPGQTCSLFPPRCAPVSPCESGEVSATPCTLPLTVTPGGLELPGDLNLFIQQIQVCSNVSHPPGCSRLRAWQPSCKPCSRGSWHSSESPGGDTEEQGDGCDSLSPPRPGPPRAGLPQHSLNPEPWGPAGKGNAFLARALIG